MKRIGLFGGSFNPIHLCHLRIARDTLARMKLDKVLFVPSGHPPHKREDYMASPDDRLEMVRLAVAGEPRFELCTYEADRLGKSYSVETVSALKSQHPEDDFFFIIGVDAFSAIAHWREPERLMALCHFIVVSRRGFSFADLAGRELPACVDPAALAALGAGRWRRKVVPLPTGKTLFFLKLAPCPVSATEIRARLKSRRDARNLLPEAVQSYIMKKELYL